MKILRFSSSILALNLAAAGVITATGCFAEGENSAHTRWQPPAGELAVSAGAAGAPADDEPLATHDGHELVPSYELADVENVLVRESNVDPSLVPPAVLAELRATLVPKAIIGEDDRKRVVNTKVAPYSAVVRLFTRFVKGGGTWGCTGTMIAPDAVLTAAHCVYDSEEAPGKGYAYSVSVVPGLYLKKPRPASGVIYNAPFGTGYGKKLLVAPRYIETEFQPWNRIAHDYAVVRLLAPIASARTRGFAARTDLLDQAATMIGFHGDLSSALRMFQSTDRIRNVIDNGTFNHYMDEAKIASGSGITIKGTNTLVGIHSSSLDGANPYNIASTITVDKQRLISTWIK